MMTPTAKFPLRPEVLRRVSKFAICLFVFALLGAGAGERFDLGMLAVNFASHGTRRPPQDVVLVTVGDETLKVLQHNPARPLPTSALLLFIEQIVAKAPRALVVDVGLPLDANATLDVERLAAAFSQTFTVLWSGQDAIRASSAAQPDGPPSAPLLNSSPRVQRAAAVVTDFALPTSAGYISHFPFPPPFPQPSSISDVLRGLFGSAPSVQTSQLPLINFYGPPGTLPSLSAELLLDPTQIEYAARMLRDKVVVFGFASPNRQRGPVQEDTFLTPESGGRFYAAEIHGTIIGNALDDTWIRQEDLSLRIFILAVLYALCAYVATSRHVKSAIVCGTALIVGIGLGHHLLLFRSLLWIPGLAFTIVLSALATSIAIVRFSLLLAKHKGTLRRIFRFSFDTRE